MGAYTLVDGQTRKFMENTLKTWKEPVPGSMESRPVFPIDITRNIENALIKARTAFVQQQQARTQRPVHALPPRPAIMANNAYLNTSTPPQNDVHFTRPPSSNGQQFGYAHQQVGNDTAQRLIGELLTDKSQTQFAQAQYSQPPVPNFHEVDTLHEDLQRLVVTARNDFAANPYDPGIQSKLKALLDLQTILQTQQLPQDQKQLIKNQVAQLKAASEPQRSTQSFSGMPHPAQYPTHVVLPGLEPQRYTSPPPAQQPPVSTTDLAKLLGSSASGREATPPVNQNFTAPNLDSIANLLNAGPQSGRQPQGAPNSSLLDQLRSAGMLPAAGPPSRPTSAAPNQIAYLAPPNTHEHSVATPPKPAAIPSRTPLAEIQNSIQLTLPSLRKPRPQLVNALFTPLPSQCNTCGRRFPATDAGRARKDRHLDFHFRSNQRLAEAARRTGISRSWFIDEMEWIRFRETVDREDDGPAEHEGTEAPEKGGSGGNKLAENKTKFIKAPTDAAMSTRSCPICQENFETVWHDGVQEWVWMDAEVSNGRVYHASCRAEVAKDSNEIKGGNIAAIRRSVTPSIPGRADSTTPESVLGKRKAENSMASGRVKREMVA